MVKKISANNILLLLFGFIASFIPTIFSGILFNFICAIIVFLLFNILNISLLLFFYAKNVYLTEVGIEYKNYFHEKKNIPFNEIKNVKNLWKSYYKIEFYDGKSIYFVKSYRQQFKCLIFEDLVLYTLREKINEAKNI